MEQYPEARIWEEITYLAYHLHWSLDSLLDLEHRDRLRMVDFVSALNDRSLEEARRLLAS